MKNPHTTHLFTVGAHILQRFASILKLRSVLIPLAIWVLAGVAWLSLQLEWVNPMMLEGVIFEQPRRMNATILEPLSERVACYGPRGKLLSESPDDELQYGDLNVRKSYSEAQKIACFRLTNMDIQPIRYRFGGRSANWALIRPG